MFIKIKKNKKYIKIDVSREECKNFQCFSPHKYTHHRTTIDGKSNNWQDEEYSCSHRNYHGCPDIPKRKT